METTHYLFSSVDHALCWATEVLRARRFPKISKCYDETSAALSANERRQQQVWYGEYGCIPQELSDRHALAMAVYGCVAQLEGEQQQLIKLRYWGDYADDVRLQNAQQHQERLRRKGVRVRLSYRYTYRQLSALLNKHHKTIGRYLAQAEKALATILEAKNLIGKVVIVKENCLLTKQHIDTRQWK